MAAAQSNLASPSFAGGAAAPSSSNPMEQLVLDRARSAFLSSVDAEHAATSVMATVVEQATDRMASNHLDRLAVPYTVRCVAQEMLAYIRGSFVGQDTGEITRSTWHADPQPSQIPMDPWARAAVAVVPPQHADMSSQLAAVGGAGKPPRGGSRTQRGGGNRRGRRGSSVSASLSSPDAGSRRASGQPSEPQQQPQRAGGKQSTSSSPGRPVKPGQQRKPSKQSSSAVPDSGTEGAVETARSFSSPEDHAHAERARQEAERRAAAVALHENITNKLNEAGADSKFTIDSSTGKVLKVAAFDPGNGRQQQQQRYTISNNPPTDLAPVKAPPNRRGVAGGPSSAPAATGPGASSPVRMGGPPKEAGGRSASRRPDPTLFYREEAGAVPMVDPLQPCGGVDFRDRETVVRGGELKMPKTRVTRSEFQRQATVGQMPTSGAADELGSEQEPPASTGRLALKRASSITAVPPQQQQPPVPPPPPQPLTTLGGAPPPPPARLVVSSKSSAAMAGESRAAQARREARAMVQNAGSPGGGRTGVKVQHHSILGDTEDFEV